MAGCRVYTVHRELADPMVKVWASQLAESSLCISSGACGTEWLLTAEEHVADAMYMNTWITWHRPKETGGPGGCPEG